MSVNGFMPSFIFVWFCRLWSKQANATICIVCVYKSAQCLLWFQTPQLLWVISVKCICMAIVYLSACTQSTTFQSY